MAEGRRERSDEVHVNVSETPLHRREVMKWRLDMPLDFRCLAAGTSARPPRDISGDLWPHKLSGDQPLCGLDARMRQVVENIVDFPPTGCRDERTQPARGLVTEKRWWGVPGNFDEPKTGGGISAEGQGLDVALLRACHLVEVDPFDGCGGK